MICYKDKTWCTFYTNCENRDKCDKVLLPSVQLAAEEAGLPIVIYVDIPHCHIEADKGDLNG